MFDEMIERIQRTTISILLKVKVEMQPAQRVPVSAPQSSANSAPTQQPQRRAFRRQMPEPLTNMSSYKEAMERAKQARAQEVKTESAEQSEK